ncbi:hypothetical protein [Streptomyces noursei]|uniref:hypothetical protein n=1 Tax=Streptomyces noursei TaxID=1971 RepID=UPI00131A08E4|nr:hypothetical protein [Streptomyces noursei]UWS76913.1 hypothetical protein N1H47_40150 [Streptomyces noursei]
MEVVAAPLPIGSPDGLLVETESQDLIVYEERLAPVHQQQVFFHEVGHFICDHPAQDVLNASAQSLLPSLDPQMIQRVLGRVHSHSEQEREAEYVGSLIGRQFGTWSQERRRSVPPEAQELAARLSALEHKRQRAMP